MNRGPYRPDDGATVVHLTRAERELLAEVLRRVGPHGPAVTGKEAEARLELLARIAPPSRTRWDLCAGCSHARHEHRSYASCRGSFRDDGGWSPCECPAFEDEEP